MPFGMFFSAFEYNRSRGHRLTTARLLNGMVPMLCTLTLPIHVGAAERPADESMESVIVTASKVESINLTDANSSGSRLGIPTIDIPASVSAISADVMELHGDTNMVDAVSYATGLATMASAGSGGYGFAVRGFGSSSVTILYDGTKSLINTGSMTYPYDTWNVERIEVLNGPASVLYGGGAIGAAINVLPRKPSDMQAHTVHLAAGSFNTHRAALDSTGPITDTLLYRFDLSNNSSDGYVERGDSSGTAVSGALTWLASDALRFTLSSDYAERMQSFYNGLPLMNGRIDKSLRHVNYSTYDTRIPFEDSRVTLVTEWQAAPDVKLTNTTYYIHGERLWRYTSQFVYQPATNQVLRRSFGTWQQYQNQLGDHAEVLWNHELFGLKNTLSTGFDVVKLSNKRYNDNYSATDLVDVYNSSPGSFPTTGTISRNYQEMTATQYSVFAEDRLMVLPQLALIAGVRADHTDVDRTDLVSNTTINKLYEPVSWRMGAVYTVTPQLNVYGQYSTAIDPVSNLCCISATQMSFDMSKGTQVEVGIKNTLWDGGLEWTLAAYRIVKNKLLTSDPITPSVSIQVGQQSSRGIEASLAWTPTMDWRIELNGTVLNAEYDDFYETVSGVRVSRNGNRPINIPEKLANLWVLWQFLPSWQAQAGAQYRGDIYANSDNTSRAPGYTVVELGLRWAATSSLRIDLRASNVFDEFYAATTAGNGGSGQWVLGAPRSFEAALTAKF